jgi:dihydrofolate synthase/folylpolyglutamate synthase
VDRHALQMGLRQATLPARIQSLRWHGRSLIIDVAHNPQAAHFLARHLQESKFLGKTLAIFAMLKDKDIAATALAVKDCIDGWYVAGITHERGATCNEVARALTTAGIQAIRAFASIQAAFKQARADAGSSDRIVVFGSFHTAQAVLTYTQNE